MATVSLRRDAQRNRAAVLDAARELFAESSDVPMYEIAKRAGVGQATLYRNFPDRESLVSALFSEMLDGLEAVAAEHRDDPDAFFIILRRINEEQVRFHGLGDCLRARPCEGSALTEIRRRLAELIKVPLRDAKAAGSLRRDVTTDDVLLIIAMVEGAMDRAGDSSGYPAAAARALTLVVDGLAARGRVG